MFNKKIIIFLIILVSLLTISAVSAEKSIDNNITSENELTIDNTVNETHLGESETDGSYNDLQNTIDQSSEYATVTLEKNYAYNSSTDSSEGVVISKTLTIDGQGHTINGNYNSRMFKIENGYVTLKNIIFTNGFAINGDGGAILGVCTAVNCTFINNIANNNGGALKYGSAINSTFQENYAVKGFSIYGGDATNCNFVCDYDSESDVVFDGTADNCHFEQSSSKRSFTALKDLINSAEDGGVLVLKINYKFVENEITDEYAFTINKNLLIIGNGHIIDADNKISMFKIEGGNVEFRNVVFKNGRSSWGPAIYGNCRAINCTFENNFANGGAGAMYLGYAENCTFTNNSIYAAVNELGGAAIANAIAVNCVFRHNAATEEGNGGAISQCTAINCLFEGNNAAKSGGAAYLSNVTNCTFTNNSAYQGGALYSGNVINCSFMDNNASQGGAIYYRAIIENCTFINNNAKYEGGAISESIAIGCIFINNTSNWNGGAMRLGHAINCIFINNTALGLQDGTGTGGGMYVDEYAKNCIFMGNFAQTTGGGMRGGDAINCTFIDNLAEISGSAKAGGSVMVCIFENNDIDADAKVYVPTYTITNTTVCTNQDLLFKLAYNDQVLEGFKTIIDVYQNNILVGSYNSTDGKLKIELTPGNYIINLSLDKLTDSVKLSSNLKVMSQTTVTPKAIMVVAGHDDCVVKLVDELNNPLSGFNVKIDFNGIEESITDENGEIKINTDNLTSGDYTAQIIFDGNEFYLSSSSDVNIHINKAVTIFSVDSVETTYGSNKNLTITLIDSQGNLISNANVSVDFKSSDLSIYSTFNSTTNDDGQISVPVGNLTPNNYVANISFSGNDYYLKSNATANVAVSKLNTKITYNNVVTTYNVNKFLVITLKDSNGNPIKNAAVNVRIGSSKNYVSDDNGQIKISTQNLAPKTYNVKISFSGNSYCNSGDATVKMVIKKATPKITAKSKKFKAKAKSKKYSITLKNNKNQSIKKTKVYLKVKSKTYVAKTNSKGKASFKLTKLTKKGKYSAKITYKGNKYYNKATKKVKITAK